MPVKRNTILAPFMLVIEFIKTIRGDISHSIMSTSDTVLRDSELAIFNLMRWQRNV